MRVKHWQGYGSVDVKKVSRYVNGNCVELHLRVRGLHEYGIARYDTYDVVRWIGTRCDKQLVDDNQVIEMSIDEDWDEVKHEDVCDYYITYLLKGGVR